MSASWIITSLSPFLNAPTLHDVVFDIKHAANSTDDSLMDLDDQQVDDTTMYAHAVVLCGRSPTFHAFFTNKTLSMHTAVFNIDTRSTPHNTRATHIVVSAQPPYSRTLKTSFTMIIEYLYTNVFDIERWADSAAVAADMSAAWRVVLSIVKTLRIYALFSKLSQFAIQNAPAAYGSFLQQQRSQSADDALSADDRFSGFLSMNTLRFGRHSATRGVYVRVNDTSDDAVIVSQSATRVYGERVKVNGQRYVRYRVDPLILAARSPYFTAMFGGDWRESHSERVLATVLPPTSPFHRRESSWIRDADDDIILADCTPEQFDSVVQFVYTDEIHVVERTSGTKQQTQTNIASFGIEQSFSGLEPALSLLTWSVVYQMPSLSEYLQSTILPAMMTVDNVCSLWPICMHEMFQANNARSSSPLHSDADALHEHCRSMVQTHFRRVIEHTNFYSLPMPLLKSALDSGMIDCDSATMCAALERWIDTQITYNNANTKSNSPRPPACATTTASSSSPSCMLSAAEMSERATAYRLALFPPATLFNRSEKRRILGISNRSFFARMQTNANAPAFAGRARV